MADHYKLVLSNLKKSGFLLESDLYLPNVCTLVAGEAMRGSWWSHPRSHDIFAVNEQLEHNPDVLLTKLVSGKVTWVHKKLWQEVLAIGTARQSWQTAKLSASAKALLKTVRLKGSLRTDKLNPTRVGMKLKPGDAARELERRLLVHAAQVHTDSGAHAKFVETWEHWAGRINFKAASISVDEAKKKMEARLSKLNEEFKATARLPWMD